MQKNKLRVIEEEIYNLFKTCLSNRCNQVLSTECESYVFRLNDYYGVAIPYESEANYYEPFSGFSLECKDLVIGNNQIKCMVLISKNKRFLREFSTVCADFVDGDENRRVALLRYPKDWCERWRMLLGNKNIESSCYSLLAEMVVYYYILSQDNSAVWLPNEYHTHDIETKTTNYEVKSTLKRYDSIIHINSEFQLKKFTNDTFLFFVRLEESEEGISFDELLNKFSNEKKYVIVDSLGDLYAKMPTRIKKMKYKILEMRKFKINDNFPLLKLDDKLIPNNVRHITYELSLDGLSNELIDLSF